MLYSIGALNITAQRFDQARRELAEAAQLFAEVGDDHGMALVTRYVASIDRLSGRLDGGRRGIRTGARNLQQDRETRSPPPTY